MAANGPEAPCGRCGAAAAPYTCPRCNRRLCSLGCYRSHGACAEAFYREQVLAALAAERAPAPAPLRRQRRLREAGDGGGGGGRRARSSLSPSERAEFLRLLRSGEAAELLPPWRPWWWGPADPRAGPAPPPPGRVPALGSLRGRRPSPLLRFQLPNVLYGYALALSLHGGDETLLPELPAAALAASAALRGRSPFASAREALEAARRDAAAAGYPRGPLGEAGVALEVARLLEGGEAGSDAVGAALAHLGRLFRDGARRVSDAEERGRFRRARRKCLYLLSWLADPEVTSAPDVMSDAASSVTSEATSTMTSAVTSLVSSSVTSAATSSVSCPTVTSSCPTVASMTSSTPPSTVTSALTSSAPPSTATPAVTSSVPHSTVTSSMMSPLMSTVMSSAPRSAVTSAVTSSAPSSTAAPSVTSSVTSSAPPSLVTSAAPPAMTSSVTSPARAASASPVTSWLMSSLAAEARRVHQALLRAQQPQPQLVSAAGNEEPDEQLVTRQLQQLLLGEGEGLRGEGLRGEGRQLIQELD